MADAKQNHDGPRGSGCVRGGRPCYSPGVPALVVLDSQAVDGDDDLVARLENTLPAAIPVGCATTLFVYGTCFDRSRQVAGLEIVVGERGHRPAAFGMPRPETFHALAPEWRAHAFRSGFWGTVPFPAVERPGTVEVGLAVRYAGGARAHVPLGRVRVVDGGAVPAGTAADGQGLIAVCMATFEPDPDLFAAQVESLRAQTDDNWVCVVSDDCSRPEHYDRIVARDRRRPPVHRDARARAARASTATSSGRS